MDMATQPPPVAPEGGFVHPELDVSSLRKMFDDIDKNGDGKLQLSEISIVLEKLKVPPTAAASLLLEGDQKHLGALDFEEFCALIRKREALVRSLFETIDDNHDGKLEPHELKTALHDRFHIDLSPAELDSMLRLLGSRNGSPVSYADFAGPLALFPVSTQQDLVRMWSRNAAMSFLLYAESTAPQSPTLVLSAGFIAGCVSRTLTAPFDRLSLCLRAGAPDIAGKSIFGALTHMVRTGGFWSLWRGNGANVVQVGPESALVFFFYEAFKKLLPAPDKPTSAEKFACGGVAGAAAMTLVYPMYVLQARLAVAEPGTFTGMWDCVRKTVSREGGLGALFKGYAPSFIRIFPYKGFDMLIFATCKDYFVRPTELITPAQSMLFGGVAASFSQTLTYPLAMARTKLSAQGMVPGKPVEYTGMIDAVRKTWRMGRAGAVYAGCGAYLIKMVPAVALQFSVYEQSLQYLRRFGI